MNFIEISSDIHYIFYTMYSSLILTNNILKRKGLLFEKIIFKELSIFTKSTLLS